MPPLWNNCAKITQLFLTQTTTDSTLFPQRISGCKPMDENNKVESSDDPLNLLSSDDASDLGDIRKNYVTFTTPEQKIVREKF